MKKYVLFFILLSGKLSAQNRDTSALHGKDPNYFDYLFNPAPDSRATLFNFRFQYLYMPSVQPFSIRGTSWGIGLNLARFFTRKFILGISVERKPWIDSFSHQRFNSAFVSDFNSGRTTAFPTYTDSLRAAILSDGINHANGGYVMGQRPFFWGFNLSPFPDRWGGFMLEVKKGWARYDFFGNFDGRLFGNEKERDNLIYFTVKGIWSAELSCKPYTFFKKGPPIFPSDAKWKDLWHYLVISFYYQQFTLEGAKFNGYQLEDFVSDAFIKKYSKQNYYGIKLGLAFY